MQALRDDPAKMAALEKEPEVGKIVLGDDIHAFNQLMKSVYEVGAALGWNVQRAIPCKAYGRRSIARCLRSVGDMTCNVVHLLQAEKRRSERLNKRMAERTIDAQRVSATVPRCGV